MKNIILVISALLIVNTTFAQRGEILHVTFEPDTMTWTSGSGSNYWILIDMDQDGIQEWRFQPLEQEHQAVEVWIQPNIHPFVDTLGLYNKLRITADLQIGDTMSSWDNWGDHPFYSIAINESYGYFPHQILCMRYQVEEGYCYGWIDFSVEFYEPAPTFGPYYADIVMHEMAYCTIPNYPFMAGQTSFVWGTEENEATAFATIHPNPTTGLVTIAGKNLKQAEVLNTLGQQVATTQGKGETLHIDIANLPTGVYFVRIMDGNGTVSTVKLLKQ